jgi:hypothetical protein
MSPQTVQTSSSSAETSFEESVAVQPMHQGNIRKPWQKKILQEYVCPKSALTEKEETTLLPLTTSCLHAPRSSKPTRNVTITSPSPVPRLLMTGRNLSSLPVRSLRSLRPSLTRLKGTKRILLPLPNRVDSCVGFGGALWFRSGTSCVFCYGIPHRYAGDVVK